MSNTCLDENPTISDFDSVALHSWRNYSGTLTPTNWKRFYIFINNLPIYKSFQQQVLKLLSHDTINIPVRGQNLVKYFNDLLLGYKIF